MYTDNVVLLLLAAVHHLARARTPGGGFSPQSAIYRTKEHPCRFAAKSFQSLFVLFHNSLMGFNLNQFYLSLLIFSVDCKSSKQKSWCFPSCPESFYVVLIQSLLPGWPSLRSPEQHLYTCWTFFST